MERLCWGAPKIWERCSRYRLRLFPVIRGQKKFCTRSMERMVPRRAVVCCSMAAAPFTVPVVEGEQDRRVPSSNLLLQVVRGPRPYCTTFQAAALTAVVLLRASLWTIKEGCWEPHRMAAKGVVALYSCSNRHREAANGLKPFFTPLADLMVILLAVLWF